MSDAELDKQLDRIAVLAERLNNLLDIRNDTISDYEKVLKSVAHGLSLLPKHLLYDAQGNRSDTNVLLGQITSVLEKHQ